VGMGLMWLNPMGLYPLPSLGRTYELECDKYGVGIGGVLLQEGKTVAYFRENLSRTSLNYSTYDKELYALHDLYFRDLATLSFA
jgi:hypothetical protein